MHHLGTSYRNCPDSDDPRVIRKVSVSHIHENGIYTVEKIHIGLNDLFALTEMKSSLKELGKHKFYSNRGLGARPTIGRPQFIVSSRVKEILKESILDGIVDN